MTVGESQLLREKIEQLRRSLAVVLETIEQLQTHDREFLLARYQEQLGVLEYRLLCLQIDVLAMQRRIAVVQARINRGEVPSEDMRAEIELAIAQELRDWFARVAAQEADLIESRQLLDNAIAVPLERAHRVKTAYRKLARMLHPDVSPENAELFDRHWASVQMAYESWDADLLEALLNCIQGECPGAQIPSDLTAQEELDRLQSLLKTQTDRLERMQNEIPFCYARWLDDPEWIEQRRASLQAEIDGHEIRLEQLASRFSQLLRTGEDEP